MIKYSMHQATAMQNTGANPGVWKGGARSEQAVVKQFCTGMVTAEDSAYRGVY